MRILKLLRRFRRSKRGATAVEYGVIAGILTLGVVVGMRSVSQSVDTNMTSYAETVNNTKDSTPITAGGGD